MLSFQPNKKDWKKSDNILKKKGVIIGHGHVEGSILSPF